MSNRKALEYLASQPWAITPEVWEVGRRIVLREADPTPIAVEQRPGRKMDGAEGVTIRDGVATIRIVGPIFRYADWFVEMCGGATVETLAKDIRAALDNGAVRAIVLDMDSPGGEATGVAELAAQIRAGTSVKPIVAYVGGMAASAGYWLASAASEIVVAPTAILGSIGVVMGYPRKRDDPRTIEFVSSVSPMKRPDPDSETGRAEVQRTVDALADVFVATVAGYRGVTAEAVLSDFGRGGVLVGSVAVSAGMADRLGSYEETLSSLASGATPKPRPAPQPSTKPREGKPTPRPSGPPSARSPLTKGAHMPKPTWLQRFFGAGVASAVEAGETIDFDAVARMERAAMGGEPASFALLAGEPLKPLATDITQSNEYLALKARYDALEKGRADSAEATAKAWVASKSTRLLPAVSAEAMSLCLSLSADDAKDGGSRLATFAALVDKLPAHNMTTETVASDGKLPAGTTALPSTADGPDPKAPPSPERIAKLLAMTDEGKAALAAALKTA